MPPATHTLDRLTPATTASDLAHLRRIVVGMDLHAPSLAAVTWCAEHLAPDAELTLVHSCGTAAARIGPKPRDRAARQLADVRDMLVGMCVQVAVVDGDPAQRITEAAEEADADLIVVGAHGAAHGPQGRLGTTAERLLRRSPVPVLLAAGALGQAPKRLLVPVTGDVSESVLHWARLFEDRFEADLAIIHLARSDRPSERTGRGAGAARAGGRWQRLASSWQPSAVFADTVAREPGVSIVTEAQRFGADLIVLDRGTLRDLHGSRAGVGVVLRRSPCSVLVVADRAIP